MSSDAEKPDVQKAQTFFQYGNDAALKSNFDYAIEMYKRACKIVPDNMVYRQAFAVSRGANSMAIRARWVCWSVRKTSRS